MFVLADIEWVTDERHRMLPTQLAAIRVDTGWNIIARFGELIKPREGYSPDWEHVAFTGASQQAFMQARTAFVVLSEFRRWLNEDDIILWWSKESTQTYDSLVRIILKIEEQHRMISLKPYVYRRIAGQTNSVGDPYKLAETRKIYADSCMKHCSRSDVNVLRELMAALSYPQYLLLQPLPVKPKKTPQPLPYRFDPEQNTIHLADCELISDRLKETRECATLDTAIKRGCLVCPCCSEEFDRTRAERNKSIIERAQYNYVYSPESGVFHRYTCDIVLSESNILGAVKYETAALTGRLPCEICRPSPDDIPRPVKPQLYDAFIKPRNITYTLPDEEVRAINRQKTATRERAHRLNDKVLTDEEKRDIYTLTQPRFAFWVAAGYQNFHLRSCPKLQRLTGIKGFSYYRDAVSAGYSPCRQCRPTSKNDAILSVPITNRVREGESVCSIEPLCVNAGYDFHYEKDFFCLETPAGKWRINTRTTHIRLEHINLVKAPQETIFHRQPRIFLSFTDAFNYIKRHDETLLRDLNSD